MIRQRFKIKEIAKDFGDAPFGSNLKSKDYTVSGIPVIQGGNIVEQKFEWNNKLYVSEEKFNSLKRSHCRAGDLVFPKIGNRTVGSCTIVPAVEGHKVFLLSTNMMKVSVKPEIANLQYVYYYFCQKHIRQYIVSIAGGGAQPIFNLTTLKNFEIELPPVPIQHKIAAILSAYDDLIENNTRRIEILEEMARSLYREWFVNFRFPGHEQVKMVDSELGLIPEGWEFGRLDDALILQRGFDLPTKQRKEGSIPIYASTGITGTHNEAKVKAPGVVTGRSGSLGTVIYVDEDFWPLNTTLWVKEFRRVTPLYAFYLLSDLKLEQYNSGAAVPTLNRNDIHGLPVVLPPQRILEQFNQFVEPLIVLKKNLIKRNDNLRQTRDLLLPKLISGEINVESFDIKTGEVAA
jgi:type I restriction enzyme S subunit